MERKEVYPLSWKPLFYVLISGAILHFRLFERQRKRLNVIHEREEPIFHYRLDTTLLSCYNGIKETIL